MCPRWGPKTERWKADWHRRYDDDPDKWTEAFEDALDRIKTAEARFNFLDAWYDVMMDEAADLFVQAYYGICGTDLRAWYDLINQFPPEWHDALRSKVATVIERDIREAALEAAREPEAAKYFRKYMVDKLDTLIFAYLERMTQSEAAELANMALHSVWNTVWWLRKYADIDLWPGWP